MPPSDGKVRLTNYEARGYGNYVILRHPNGLETVYGHLNKALVKPDQVVRARTADRAWEAPAAVLVRTSISRPVIWDMP